MTTTHIVDLVLAVLIVTTLAGVCRLAFLVAGHLPLGARPVAGEDEGERLAA